MRVKVISLKYWSVCVIFLECRYYWLSFSLQTQGSKCPEHSTAKLNIDPSLCNMYRDCMLILKIVTLAIRSYIVIFEFSEYDRILF